MVNIVAEMEIERYGQREMDLIWGEFGEGVPKGIYKREGLLKREVCNWQEGGKFKWQPLDWWWWTGKIGDLRHGVYMVGSLNGHRWIGNPRHVLWTGEIGDSEVDRYLRGFGKQQPPKPL